MGKLQRFLRLPSARGCRIKAGPPQPCPRGGVGWGGTRGEFGMEKALKGMEESSPPRRQAIIRA